MSCIRFLGAVLVIAGVPRLKTYIQKQRWPVVQGTFDSVDEKIEATAYPEGVGFSVHPKFIQKIPCFYQSRPYAVDILGYDIIVGSPELRVNAEKPYEAYLDNKTWIYPAFAISIGIILILA